ncbi:MAG: ATP-binding protein [Gammaproteobacteria bacterium]|nr:ATP-binding protein [Gammaproteobacteria bacterium]
MIKRDIFNELIQSAHDYPVVTVIGPRQAGKTTLVKQAFPDYAYCNLEHPELRSLALHDPNALFSKFSGNCIFDEIQRVPELLSYIQVRVDEEPKKGRYILTGSHQLALHQSVSQSLAGRTALLKLLPLSLRELRRYSVKQNRYEYIYKGFLPGIYKDSLNPTKAYRNYYETYIERDVRQLIHLKELAVFEKFLKLLAGRSGQVLNLSSLGNDVGVSGNTLKNWLSVLEASFIIFKLEPYYENFGKRVIKSPKIYFTDTGLLTYLLGIENPAQLERDPLIGNIFENLVITEALKTRFNQGLDHHLFYFRTAKGEELDLIFKQGCELVPVEIKSSMTFHQNFAKGITYFKRLTKSKAPAYIVFTGDAVHRSADYEAVNYLDTSRLFGLE